MALRTLSICTGEAGLELGVELSGVEIEPVCYVEREIYAVANLVRLIKEGVLADAPAWSDVRTICDAEFRDFMAGREIDLICGGYPCQPFSAAGKRRGTGDPRHLWPSIADAIGLYKPALCFFENVPGHLTLGFETVLDDLQRMGYEVAAGLFGAAEVDASHKRERLFILAHRKGNARDIHTGQRRPRQTKADAAGPGGKELAHTHNAGQRPGDSRIESNPTEHRRDRFTDANETLADAGGTGPQGGELRETPGGRDGTEAPRSTAEFRIPLFPPGPDDRAGWCEIVDRHPHLVPAVESDLRIVVDGLSFGVGEHRNHRLRLHGNAVVPLQAAYAFTTLMACLHDTERRTD